MMHIEALLKKDFEKKYTGSNPHPPKEPYDAIWDRRENTGNEQLASALETLNDFCMIHVTMIHMDCQLIMSS